MPEARSAALNRQLLQLLDAALVWVAFRAAGNLVAAGEPGFLLRQGWILYLVVPFTPLILECSGYYRTPSKARSGVLRLLAGVALMALVLGAVPLGFGTRVERPVWVVAGFAFALLLLRARDTFVARAAESPHRSGPT